MAQFRVDSENLHKNAASVIMEQKMTLLEEVVRLIGIYWRT